MDPELAIYPTVSEGDLFEEPSNSSHPLPVAQNLPHRRTTPRRSQMRSAVTVASSTLSLELHQQSFSNSDREGLVSKCQTPGAGPSSTSPRLSIGVLPGVDHPLQAPPFSAPTMHHQHAGLRVHSRSPTSDTGPSHGYNDSGHPFSPQCQQNHTVPAVFSFHRSGYRRRISRASGSTRSTHRQRPPRRHRAPASSSTPASACLNNPPWWGSGRIPPRACSLCS